MTPSKCLPWERTTVRKRGQKRALSLRYPSRNWKTRKNSEKMQNQEKWQKSENHQKSEKQKKWKSDKSEKCKTWKSDKSEKWKMSKNSEKSDPPWKRPKCQINGQKPHFVNSEPPGWALFEFQGVPRDPVLRPKSTPSFLNGKCDRIFTFSSFVICAFWWNWHFMKVWSWSFFGEVTFCGGALCHYNKALLCYIRESESYVWWFSPLIGLCIWGCEE